MCLLPNAGTLVSIAMWKIQKDPMYFGLDQRKKQEDFTAMHTPLQSNLDWAKKR